MEQTKQYVEEDEIDLRELWETIVKRKILIFLITATITFVSIIYISFKTYTPIYSASILIEIGQKNDMELLEKNRDLKIIVEKKFDIQASFPNGTEHIITITSFNKEKKLLPPILKTVSSFIIERHIEKSKLFNGNYIETQQIGNVVINPKPINDLNKSLIVIITFFTSFVSSIFLIFFLEFINIQHLLKKVKL